MVFASAKIMEVFDYGVGARPIINPQISGDRRSPRKQVPRSKTFMPHQLRI